MASKPTGDAKEIQAKDIQTEQAGIKRKLAWRMGFAGLMIVMLLGTLAVFDHLNVPEEPEPAAVPRFSEAVPVPKKEITQPVKPAEPLPEASREEKKTAEPEASSAPVEPPARPEVAAQPAAQPAAQRATPYAPRAQPYAEVRTQPLTRPLPPAQALAPQQALPTAPHPAPSRAAAPLGVPVEAPAIRQQAAPAGGNTLGGRLFSGFALQAGVFSDPRLAEELHAKLTLNGIPSTLEARVQVGPFKTREEADAAREKMRLLGIDAVLLPPKATAHR